MRHLALTLLVTGCAPVLVGPARVLPDALNDNPLYYAQPNSPARKSAIGRKVLANGAWVTVTHRPGTRFVTGAVVFRCGRVDEPAGRAGLLELYLALLSRLDHDETAGPEVDLGGAVDDGEAWLFFTTPRAELRATLGQVLALLDLPGGAERFDEVQRVVLARRVRANRTEQRVGALERRAVNGHLAGLTQVPEETLAQVTYDELKAFARECTTSRNLAVALSGELRPESVDADLAPLLARADGPRRVRNLAPAAPLTRRVLLVPHESERVEVKLLGPGLLPGTRSRAAAMALSAVFASEFHRHLREKLGQIYSVQADIEVGPANGTAWISFSTRRERAVDAVRAALELLRSWAERWALPEEAMPALRVTLRRKYGGWPPVERAFFEARRALVDAEHPTRAFEEELDAVRAADLSALFSTTFSPRALQVVVSGDVPPDPQWHDLGPVEVVRP